MIGDDQISDSTSLRNLLIPIGLVDLAFLVNFHKDGVAIFKLHAYPSLRPLVLS